MNGPIKLASLVAALAIAACNAGGSSNIPTSAGPSPAQSGFVPQWKAQRAAQHACPDLGPRYAQCMVLVQTDIEPNVGALGPVDFRTRYHLPSSTRGAGQIVAIIDAFDNPHVASDLAIYRRNFGLGTAKFNKYNQEGEKKNYPRTDLGWGVEIDLDVQMVSAVCPKCTIDLFEAAGSDTHDLEIAEAEAVKLRAHIVSNSWGCPGSNTCVHPRFFEKPGVLYLASAGDDGYGTGAPAALGTVVSVGGTVLTKTGNGYSETVWDGSGSGCALHVLKPSWQRDKGCSARTMNDVAAVAAGVAEYDSFGYPGWIEVMGTSIASPMLAGIYGLAENADSQVAGKKFWTLAAKRRPQVLHDITQGSDGFCAVSYLCTARAGYDGPTGWGTPNGLGAF